MAGFIFSISSTSGTNGVEACIEKGIFSAKVPLDIGSSMAKQVVASVLCDYLSMRPGDNVYFLSKRKIYGVGKLTCVPQTDTCILKNYPSAHLLETMYDIPNEEETLLEPDPAYRWMCFFSPEERFFKTGVDMDDVLLYRPHAFRMLRAFQDRSFIKIDDEENRALKEFIYLSNQNDNREFTFDTSFHEHIASLDLTHYNVRANDTIAHMHNLETCEVGLEMLVEAAVIEELQKENQ